MNIKESANPGDIVFISKKKKGIYNRIVPPIIRWATKTEYHHVGILNMYKGKLTVFEAVFKGFLPTQSWEDYLKEEGKDYDIMVFNKPNDAPENWSERLFNISGCPYDFGSLIVVQLLYQITRKLFGKGIWVGKKGTKALHKIYCTEAIAYIYMFDKWWKYAPNHLLTKLKQVSTIKYQS